MNAEHLTTHLNDHLAGSVAALELLDHLIEQQGGTPLEKFLAPLRTEIEEDQSVLRDLLRRLGAPQSRARKAAAWLAEKLGRAKLAFTHSDGGELKVVEALEALLLGLHGKLALWRVPALVVNSEPRLKGVDFARLEPRAREQHERVETHRLQTARVAFGAVGPAGS